MYGAFAYIGADLRQRFGLSYTLVGAVMAVYGAGAILYSMTARRLIAKLGEAGLVIGGGVLMAVAFAGLAFAPRVEAVPPLMVLLGLAFYMMHNTLQNNATQMAPEARGLGVSIFALALFFGQSIGVAAAAPIMDRFGAPPIFLAATCTLPLVALWFRARLGMRPG
jgi:predicted MFS family arabinose efflux permease